MRCCGTPAQTLGRERPPGAPPGARFPRAASARQRPSAAPPVGRRHCRSECTGLARFGPSCPGPVTAAVKDPIFWRGVLCYTQDCERVCRLGPNRQSLKKSKLECSKAPAGCHAHTSGACRRWEFNIAPGSARHVRNELSHTDLGCPVNAPNKDVIVREGLHSTMGVFSGVRASGFRGC